MKKKTLIITIVAGALVLALACAAVCIAVSNSKKTTVIGFYGLSESCAESIQKHILETTTSKVSFRNLNQNDLDKKNFEKNVSMLFAYNDANTQSLTESAVPLTDDVLSRIPTAMKKSYWYRNSKEQTVVMPVVLDNFESSVLRTTRTKYGVEWPFDAEGLMDFGKSLKKYYPSPMITAGANDENILSLFTEVVIAYCGQTGYRQLKTQLEDAENLDDFENFVIYSSNAGDEILVKDLIGKLRDLQRNGVLASNFAYISEKEANVLIDDNRIGAIFMNLSENRNKTMPNIYYYEVTTFPVETEYKEISVQPAVVCLSFKNSGVNRKIMDYLSSEECQTELSLETQLGPAMLRGAPCDIQADEARYLAASTEGGPVPDLGTASFKTQEKRHELAEKIRSYFN